MRYYELAQQRRRDQLADMTEAAAFGFSKKAPERVRELRGRSNG